MFKSQTKGSFYFERGEVKWVQEVEIIRNG
jgi:hypothetical protein